MSANELFNMEVRDASDSRKLLGWLLVPLDVYQGERGDSWNVELRHHYGDQDIRRMRLPIARFATPDGHEWFALQIAPADLQLLREVVGFAGAR